MSNLLKQYSTLAELMSDTSVKDTFDSHAKARGVGIEQLAALSGTLQNIEKNKNIVPTMYEFSRVRVGKLTVPANFLRHIELLAKFAGVSEESIWQLLMIETCQLYASRYAEIVEVLNSTVAQRGTADD